MNAKEYISKYKLSESDKFNHSEFVSDLTLDFLALLEIGKANENLKGFNNAVNAIRMKFDAINNKTVGNIPEKLWNYFFATVIVKFREKLFPVQMEQIRKEREEKKRMYEERKNWENKQFGFGASFFDDMFFYAIIADLFKSKIPEKSFELLELTTTATIDDVKSSYRKLSMLHHPDKGGNKEKFIELTDAKNKCLTYLSQKS
jgi:hypothetical protein